MIAATSNELHGTWIFLAGMTIKLVQCFRAALLLVLSLLSSPGMKAFSITVLLAAIFSFSSFGQTAKVREIELSKLARGYQEHIRINADSLHVLIENRKDERSSRSFQRPISHEEWSRLLHLVKDLKLKDLPALPSPTMKRAADAAMHATITIYTNDGQSYSHGYDDEDPHLVLQPLRTAMREIATQKEK